MKRVIYKDLIAWKDSKERKPLLLYGARQVGKTYILKEFGNNEFEDLIYFNCDNNTPLRNLFSENYDTIRIIEGLKILSGRDFRPRKCLIFFDEVQEIPSVVHALKYFCENEREYCIAAAGSLLGVHDLKGYSFPVGKVDILYLYPMSFPEFLWAMGEEKKGDILQQKGQESLINDFLPVYIDYLRKYYFTGGMPEAVKRFVENGNVEEVRGIQRSILNGYYADIAKHSGDRAQRCRQVLASVPSQLSKENKKFVYGTIKKGARAKEYEKAIQWLIDAGIIYRVPRITKPQIPLKFYIDENAFKLYMLDVGLLGAMVEAPPSEIMIGDNIFSEYKGAFTENYVLTQIKTLKDTVIGYYSKENSLLEVDFIVQKGSEILAIEVKSEENVKSKSLRQFVTIDHQGSGIKGVRVSMLGFKDQDWMINIPLPAAGLI